MDFFTQEILWGVHIWQLFVALVLIFTGFLMKKVISSLFGGLLKDRAGRTRAKWDDDLVSKVAGPLALVLQILLWYAAAAIIVLPEEPVDVRILVFQGLDVAVAVSIVWLLFRLIDVAALVMARFSDETESRLDDQLVPLLRKTLKIFVALIIGVMIVQNLGYSVTSVIASLGIGGLALALAAKDAVANFFGSLVVFTDQPFHVGDWISVDDLEGVVEEVGFRTTLVRKFDKSLATVPNQVFTTSTITNHSMREMRRIKLTVGITYEAGPADIEELKRRVSTILAGMPIIDPSFHVYFDGFGASSLDLLVMCFARTTDYVDFMSAREELMLKVMRTVDDLGLEMAFPTRTVYLRDEGWQGRQADISGTT